MSGTYVDLVETSIIMVFVELRLRRETVLIRWAAPCLELRRREETVLIRWAAPYLEVVLRGDTGSNRWTDPRQSPHGTLKGQGWIVGYLGGK